MTIRHIKGAETVGRSLVITLDCGHERSIGGGVFPDRRPSYPLSALLGQEYDCKDGRCLGKMP